MAQHSPGFLKLVEDALKEIRECSVEDVKKNMTAASPKMVIDCREDNEWQAGHIPGAVHMGRGIIERDIEQKVPDHNQDIVLYCGGGYRSALAALNLKRMGYTKVLSMAGGMRGWKDAGHEVKKP